MNFHTTGPSGPLGPKAPCRSPLVPALAVALVLSVSGYAVPGALEASHYQDDEVEKEEPTEEQPGEESGEEKDEEDGDDPGDTPPPETYGEEIEDDCDLIDIDIFKPAAQDSNMPRVDEDRDASAGAWTIRNNDMDASTASILADRLHDRSDLLRVDGKPDLAMAAVPEEDDLVKIELLNPNKLPDVFLCAYAMAHKVRGLKVKTKAGFQKCSRTTGKLKIWRTATRTGPVRLPHQAPNAAETLWVEGLKAGRYRLVLFHLPGGALRAAAGVKAKEPGDPHGERVNADVTLKPPLACRRNVRLTVTVVDIYQKGRRKHVYDILWGGRAVVDGHVWPGGGSYLWTTSGGLNGTWETGTVHGVKVKKRANAPGGSAKILLIHGGFAPNVTGIGTAVTGTAEYAERFALKYRVEGVLLERHEPVTLMAPHRVEILRPRGDLTRFGAVILGNDYAVSWQVKYKLHDQIGAGGRLLVGPSDSVKYIRQYGSRLQMYEALGMGTNATEDANEQVKMRYRSPNPNRRFELDIQTKQRPRAIPRRGSLSNAEFTDNFRLGVNRRQRGIIQADIVAGNLAGGANIFQVRQDVVVLLNNGLAEYDVRVSRGQVLEIKGPAARPTPAASWGGLGFRMQLGGAGGTVPDTGRPDRVAAGHNP